ncbi:MAG: radical SAM/SPASM domain-containing protein [Thermoanaerobaculia bacterium]|nr:radical SAM/SPASM domain-containing protein [Thermoanaerobaculia bacterium]
MALSPSLPIVGQPRPLVRRLVANPFLHVGSDHVYNPLTDQHLRPGEPGYDVLRGVVEGTVEPESIEDSHRTRLHDEGWLVSEEEDLSRRFYLKYVSLEAHTVCNQSCYFCPVSVAPREAHFMPTEQYEEIVSQLAAYRETIEAVFMISYNEPTVDKRWVDQVRSIKEAGLPPATLTNGTGLTPERVDAIEEMGGLRFLSINLSTVNREKYREDRGGDHLEKVLRNLEYAKDRRVAEEMDIVVLGVGDDVHQRDFDQIRERFSGSRFNVKHFVVNDRAGYLQIGLRAPKDSSKELCGCDHMGSRPLQHLHITPRAECILCCQDYNESVVVGDLSTMTVEEVLTGPEMARARRQVYGIEEAPADFICRDCKFALVRRR